MREDTSKNSIDTRSRILDAAESLFMEYGFDGTSMRLITAQAGVNLAAINYHFGSKELLFQEVFRRRLTDLNRRRIAVLDALEAEAGGAPLKPSRIVEAFFGEALRMAADVEGGGHTFMRLLGRTYTDPNDFVRQFLAEEYAECVDRFLAALHPALVQLLDFHFLDAARVGEHDPALTQGLHQHGVAQAGCEAQPRGGLRRQAIQQRHHVGLDQGVLVNRPQPADIGVGLDQLLDGRDDLLHGLAPVFTAVRSDQHHGPAGLLVQPLPGLLVIRFGGVLGEVIGRPLDGIHDRVASQDDLAAHLARHDIQLTRMDQHARFLTQRAKVSWKAWQDQGAWRVEATHPDSLLGMTWRWPSARFDRPEVLSGQAQVRERAGHWLVEAGDGRGLSLRARSRMP